jgi:hypothetical protein
MAYAFNQMTQREAERTAEQMNNSRGPHKWTAVQLEDGTWNVMSPEDAAQRAAGLNPDTGGMASGSGQVGASGFFLAGGVSVSTGVAADTSGNTCAFYSVCLQAGLGLGAGAGGGGSLSVSEVEPGVSWPKGPFIFGGSGLFGSGSADIAGQAGSLDIAGPGFGAGGGYQWCVQNNYACSD